MFACTGTASVMHCSSITLPFLSAGCRSIACSCVRCEICTRVRVIVRKSGQVLDKCEGCEMVVRGWLSYTECFTTVRGIRQYNSEDTSSSVGICIKYGRQ